MDTSLGPDDLAAYVASQLSAFFPDERVAGADLARAVTGALERAEHCFSNIRRKYFLQNDRTVFDHVNTDQYAMFLYLLSNTLFRMEESPSIAAKVYALNKALHAIDAFYAVELPDIFLFQHPVGTVLGRATYGDYFCAYQRCSVGANLDDAYPTIGRGVVMYGGSAIIGASRIGDNCLLSMGATVMDAEIPSNSVIFGASPELLVKSTKRDVVRDIFAP
jgi:serine O-acetyltransferase